MAKITTGTKALGPRAVIHREPSGLSGQPCSRNTAYFSLVTHHVGIFSQKSHLYSLPFSLAFYYFKKYLCLINLLYMSLKKSTIRWHWEQICKLVLGDT